MANLDNSPFDLTGRRILISGAAGGIRDAPRDEGTAIGSNKGTARYEEQAMT
jgi:hypothetical protein